MIKITIHIDEDKDKIPMNIIIPIEEDALELVGYEFNPSALSEADVSKILAAAQISHVDNSGNDGRASAIAKTNIEQSAMWAVTSITRRLLTRDQAQETWR